MTTDLTVQLEHRPGALAEAAEALGNAGVNIEGFFAHGRGQQGEAHFLVEDADAARAALEAAGGGISAAREVVVVDVEDRPGVLGEVTRRAADAGVNLTLAYVATDTRLVLASDDLAALRQAVGR